MMNFYFTFYIDHIRVSSHEEGSGVFRMEFVVEVRLGEGGVV